VWWQRPLRRLRLRQPPHQYRRHGHLRRSLRSQPQCPHRPGRLPMPALRDYTDPRPRCLPISAQPRLRWRQSIAFSFAQLATLPSKQVKRMTTVCSSRLGSFASLALSRARDELTQSREHRMA
jgi:hypothetical protein